MHGSFSTHTKNITHKAQKRNNIIKALASSSWGQHKETLTTTYKAITRPILEYASPAWTRATASQLQQIQTVQNTALRTVTGCHLITHITHLHHETKVLTIKQHTDMINKQCLLRTHLPHHPCHTTTSHSPQPRQLRQTLQSTHEHSINALKDDPTDTLTTSTYKSLNKQIHTDTAKQSILTNSYNTTLNAQAPHIHSSEQLLPRKARTTLAQLRSGHSIFLNSYKSRISPDTSPTCPHCNISNHTTTHLFTCTPNSTPLSADSLWGDPVGAARCLDLSTWSEQ
jgi:hypothetical protein